MLRPFLRLVKPGLVGAVLFCSAAGAVQAKDSQPFFGLQIQGLSPTIANALDLEKPHGVLVRDIAFPGPASHSGLQRGDLILVIEGKAVESVDQVVGLSETLKAGQEISMRVMRRGKELDVTVKLGARPPRWDIRRNSFATIAPMGVTFAALTDKVRERFAIGWRSRGVVVSLVDEKKAASLDLRVGDVVVQVNQSSVWKPSHVISAIKRAQKEKREMVLLLVEGAEGFRFVLLPVPVPAPL